MSATSRIAAAVSGGHLLGRTRELRFAIVIGGAIPGRRYPTSLAGLVTTGARHVDASPGLEQRPGAPTDVRERAMEGATG